MQAGLARIEGDEGASLPRVSGLALLAVLCVDVVLLLLPAAVAFLVLTGALS